jgi:hypothetical protein
MSSADEKSTANFKPGIRSPTCYANNKSALKLFAYRNSELRWKIQKRAAFLEKDRLNQK